MGHLKEHHMPSLPQPAKLSPAAPPITAHHKGKPLSRKAKAAIIVQYLLNEGADLPLSSLPEDMQSQLTLQMGAMRYVDRNTLSAVVREFAQELDAVGLRFPGDMAQALDALDGKISPQTARRLRKEAGVRQSGDPWAMIAAQETDKLEKFAVCESIEVAAVMLSKLSVDKAAKLLGQLPGERARRITYAMSLTANITPDAVDRIGISLASQLASEPAKAFEDAPVKRLGAILNYSSTNTREDVLVGLDETDEAFAEAVRRAIFTFSDIPNRLQPIDIPKIPREVDQIDLVKVIAGATSDGDQTSVAFLLNGISKRMAETLREEAGELGKVGLKDCEAAQMTIVNAIQNMVQAGEITLVSPDEGEAD